jgi:hypothetical protein
VIQSGRVAAFTSGRGADEGKTRPKAEGLAQPKFFRDSLNVALMALWEQRANAEIVMRCLPKYGVQKKMSIIDRQGNP